MNKHIKTQENIGSVLRICYGKSGQALQQGDGVASIISVWDSWRAQVRRKGYPLQTKTFPKKVLAGPEP